MNKKLDKIVYDMTSDSFRIVIDTLFELEEKCFSIKSIELDKNVNKKRIAIIYDKEGWAFCNTAKQIKKKLEKYYDITIFSHDAIMDNSVKLFILAKEFDLVYCMWRGEIANIESDYSQNYIKSLGYTFEEFKEKFIDKTNIITFVPDHNFLEDKDLKITKTFIKYVKNYVISSKILFDIYNKLDIDKKPFGVITDGVDLDVFKPINLERFKLDNLKNRTLKIGWAGNSKFVASDGNTDLKGLNTIIRPAINELKQEGYNIEEKFADRNVNYIPSEDMPKYYNSIDLYICASSFEGTPLPILEAMAVGLPIISTNVGIVNEALGIKQKEYILPERTKECLKEYLKKLINNLEQFDELSKENLEQVKSWSWDKKCNDYKNFFDKNF